PSSRSRCTKASVDLLWVEAVFAPRNPMVGSLPACCARARLTLTASNRPAPPTRAVNSRRVMSDMGQSPAEERPLATDGPYCTLLPQSGRPVLAADLHCSGSGMAVGPSRASGLYQE